MIEIEDYYWDYCNATTAGQYLDSQERSIIYEFLDNCTPRLCLDIACGSGRFSLSLAKRGICVVAGERYMVPIKKLQCSLLGCEIWKKNTHILQIDAEHLPFHDKTYDCVLSIQTLSYTNAQQFISECNRILQCDGWLLFNDANRHSYKAPIHRKISSSTRFYHHSYSEICSMLNDSGFRIQKAVGMNWLPIKRDSDNKWIAFASKIEDWLKLSDLPSISPWVFYVAQKTRESTPNTGGKGQW